MRVAESLVIPDEVERARQAGELVVFAGAGISIDPPASMPDFVALARRIAEGKIGWDERRYKERLDRYLGDAERRGVDVQTRARDELRPNGRTHTLMHEHLLGLFEVAERVRLITTNFDPFFDWTNFLPFVAQRPGSDPLPGALAPAIVSAFFAFGGWWEIGKLAGEARNPARTLPRALALGVASVTAIYIVMSAVFLYLVPLDAVSSNDVFAARAGQALFGRAGGTVLSIIVIVAILGSLLALLMALPRVYYAMARDGVFLRSVAVAHRRYGTPARAIAIQATLASVLVVLGTFNQIVTYFVFVTVLFVGLTVTAVFMLRRRGPAAYSTPGFPLTPLFFLLLVAVLLVLLVGHNPLQSLAGVAIVALGAPVYLLAARARLTSVHTAGYDT